MRIAFPYVRQEKDYDCGPAAVKMVLERHGAALGLDALRRKMKTNPRTGTSREAVRQFFRQQGFAAEDRWNCSAADLFGLLDAGRSVIVDYREPEEGVTHFAVVSGHERGRILLHDPWHGPYFGLSERAFISRWYGRERLRTRRWALIVAPKQ